MTGESGELPLSQGQLEELAEYYSTYSAADDPEAEHGERVEPST
ncbi:hypothetical protein [Saccharopolyspora sp. NPDC002376]